MASPREWTRQALLGGPGHDGYAYNADVYCVDCGRSIIRKLASEDDLADPTEDPSFRDSERQPQPIFFGESDSDQHCADCGAYLYGPEPDAEDGDDA